MSTDREVALLHSMIDRAGKLTQELKTIYDRDLSNKEVSAEALNLTHEIIEKCSNSLDQSMSLLFERSIKPHLTDLPKKGGYFPAGKDEHAYKSTLGQWNASDLQNIAPEIDDRLRSLQPFTASRNAIYAQIKAFAAHKHTGLRPQTRNEQRRVNVTRPGQGGVSWGPGVKFGQGVHVMGVPINPATQMPAHSEGINIDVEVWVSFLIEETGQNALDFCNAAIGAARAAIEALHPPTA